MRLGRIGILLAALAIAASGLVVFLTDDRERHQTPAATASETADWLAALAQAPVDGLGRPREAWELSLPEDHAPHPQARSEAWLLTAHLQDEAGSFAAVQFALLRIGLMAPDKPPSGAGWEGREIYRGHVVLLDSAGHRAMAEERIRRGMPGVAGLDPNGPALRLDDWAIAFGTDGGQWQLRAGAGDASAELALIPLHPANSADAAEAPFRGYGFSRMQAEGTLNLGGQAQVLSGTAWFEHLWGDLPLPDGGPIASDRLILHLDDGSDLSVTRARRADGRGSATVEAFIAGAGADAGAIGTDAAEMEPLRHWQGRHANWPVAWTLRLDDLLLAVTPVAEDQEHDFIAPVWSGLVRAEGQRGGRRITATGTLQLTGYADP